MSSAPPLLAACLTPPGSAAIAVVAIRGPGAWEAVLRHFRPRGRQLPPREEVEPGQFWLGRMGQEVADEVVFAVKKLQPVPWVEIQCHGGREVVAWLLELLQQVGAEICSWQDLERRTADDPLQALAAVELAHAPTVRTAAILLDQYHGAFRRAIESARHTLAATTLGPLTRYRALGRHLVRPWRVVVAGAVNAGKSSLVNALAGYQRSIVAAMPGTTRDVVTVRLAVDGWPVELADTAGLRQAGEELEEQGIQLARDAAAEADLCLWLLDASAEPLWPEPGLKSPLLVINKIDLPAAWDLDGARDAVRVSALRGGGLAALLDAVAARLVPDPPPAGAAVPFTAELGDRVAAAESHLKRGQIAEADAILAGCLVADSIECSPAASR